MNVSLQMFAYHEKNYTATLDAWAAQEVAGASIEREVWVTPSCPDLDNCRTYQQAEQHPDWTAHTAPKGKLAARNAAHDHAVDAGSEVVIVTDADAPPLRDDTLASLLSPFSDDRVVAVNSRTVTPGLWGAIVDPLGRLEDAAAPQMHGQLSAFTAYAWDVCGPFDTSINQTDGPTVRRVEERLFRSCLDDVGWVVTAPGARVLNHPRRLMCTVDRHPLSSGQPGSWCRGRGVETFNTARDEVSK